MKSLVIATRKSPLALVQTEMVAALLTKTLGVAVELNRIVTTGDRRTDWSLEKKGGKGLFTGELEAALRRGEADLAVHSTKDLPGEMAEDLAVAGYLPRADARDVLILREGISAPKSIATGSPRRRLQVARLFPSATFSELRGNVDTRLRKIAEGHEADATLLAAAGLERLGHRSWPGLVFRPLALTEMVPAVGQGAIAVQCRSSDVARFKGLFDEPTGRAIALERAFQESLGAGCQTAFGAHVSGDTLYFFHEQSGFHSAPLSEGDWKDPRTTAARILRSLRLA